MENQPISTENIILIDWITFTSKIWSVDQLKCSLGLSEQTWDLAEYGRYGYKRKEVFNGVSILYDIRVDGDNDIVTVSLPVDSNRFEIVDLTAGTRDNFYGNEIVVHVTGGNQYNLGFALCFDSTLSLANIPSDTVLKYSVSIDQTSWGYVDFTNTHYDTQITYLDAQGSFISSSYSQDSALDSSTYLFARNLTDAPANADSFYTWLYLKPVVFSVDRAVTLSVNFCELEMTISSLYRLQQESGKTNTILKEVEKQLEDQGKTLDEVLKEQQQTNDKLGDLSDKQDQTNDKLDEIINGTVDPSAPAGSDSVGDLDDTEAGLRDDAQSGLDQGLQVQQSALDIVLQYASAFACVGWIFNKFADIPFFSGLLYVSMALGIYGTILGVGLSVSRAGSRAGGRSGKGG